jgi:4-hydroxy-3-methylbut-2-enyl diphosphate reductase
MIYLPKVYGTCFGSNRAINLAYEKKDENICVYKEILHNEELIKDLEKNGIYCVDKIPKDKTVIIRAHGEAKEVFDYLNDNNIKYYDATCPNVKRVQRLINEHYVYGFNIVILGKKNHPEVIGENGWCDNKAIIIENKEDINKITEDNLFIVVQTTYNEDLALEIVEEIKSKFNEVKFVNTICNAQKLNQEHAMKLAKDMDYMIVIGGKKSSNTKELYKACESICKSYLVSSKEELKEILKEIDLNLKIGITAGASTPGFQVEEYIEIIKNFNNF